MAAAGFVGYCCCAAAVLMFGSNFLPVKSIDTGDGIWFGFCMSLGILIMGVATDMSSLTTPGHVFEPLCIIGGVTWAVGNIAGPVIIQRIGMGMAVTVWGLTNMVMGWATGNFGLMGIDRGVVANPTLNYIGVAVAACAGVAFGLVQPEDDEKPPEPLLADKSAPKLRKRSSSLGASAMSHVDVEQKDHGGAGYMIGFAGALLAGCFFGSMFDIATVMIQGAPANGHSAKALDYILPQTLGIVAFNSLVFICYLAYKKSTGGKPYVARSVVLPAMISGAMWAIAFISWNVANAGLSLVIAFPIITTGPSVVSMAIGIGFFGEYKKFANLAKIGVAFVFAISGVILISQSACTDVVSVAACPDGKECIHALNAGVFRYCGDS